MKSRVLSGDYIAVVGEFFVRVSKLLLDRKSVSKVTVIGVIGSAATALAVLGAGSAQAVPTCAAANSQVEHITASGGCGAKAGAGSIAHSQDTSNGGIAVAVSQTGGNSNAYNLNAGSSALSGARSQGNSYAVTTGPGATAVARARLGGVSIALAGIGGGSYAGDGGVRCSGGFAAAFDSNTGQACIGGGSLWLSTPHRTR